QDADVILRAGLDAVQAERAVHVPRLAGEEQVKLAATLALVAAQAIVGSAAGAYFPTADFDFERRNKGAHEMELANGTDIFAEARSAEEGVHDEGTGEVGPHDPGGPERCAPEVKGLEGPEEKDEQAHSQPLGAQGARPTTCGEPQPSAQLARQHERAG